jgi:phage/plasmid primase-like uncharacterized protein/RecA-family ATPase
MMTTESEHDFRQAIEAEGLTPPSGIIADGEVHRFPSNGDPSDDAGWYVFHQDDVPAGAYGDWRTGIHRTWSARNVDHLTGAERHACQQRLKQLEQQRTEEKNRRHTEVAAKAAEIFGNAPPAPPNHPYLVLKGISQNGARLYRGSLSIAGRSMNGALIVPLVDVNQKLCSLEFITDDGSKFFLSGGRKQGCFHTIGDPTKSTETIGVGEGFATGASVHEATGQPVAIAFDAGNLKSVAEALHAKYPHARILILGDNDLNEVGQTKAREAAQAVNGSVVIPSSAGADWNDVHKQDGMAAVRTAIQQAAQDQIDVVDLDGAYQVQFSHSSVTFQFHRITENARGVQSEITVTIGHKELLSGTDVSLKSPHSRDGLVRSLSQTETAIPWKRLVEQACSEVLKRHRRGEPIVELKPADSIHTPFVLNPIVYRGHQTLIFAPGGSYKSYLALYFSLLAMAGLRQNGIAAIGTNILYLDWELDAETVGTRLKALHMGHSELTHLRPYYRRCTQPLHLEAPQIAAEVARRGVGLVIVDSAALACGGDLNSPESAIRLQQALRRIGCASIVLAHVSKSTTEGQDKSAYGTVFFRELARNVWELSRPENTNRVLLSQTGTACKNSFGRKQDPLGFEFSFESERVKITAFNPADEEESAFEEKLPLRDRIRALLLDMRKRSAKEIAEGLHAPEGSVKVTLSSNRQLFTRSGPYRQGVWTLAASVKAPQGSLIPIVNAPIDNLPLRSLNGGKSMQPKELNSQDKQIVNNIVNNRYDPSLINGGVPIGDPSLTINDPTPVNDSQPEEVIDL